MRKCLTVVAALAVLGLTAVFAQAAAPDGPGPWADTVVDFDQQQRADGTPVLPSRSDPTDALGEAEDTNAEGTFFSLGFGGRIDLGFDNVICNGPGADIAIEIHEVTREPYPAELVDVYVSEDGVTWVLAASNVNKDAQVAIPKDVDTVRFVRLIDVSDPDAFAGLTPPADGFDVDGVRALNTDCRMTGGGKLLAGTVTHGFTLHCDVNDKPNRLTVHWQTGTGKNQQNNVFHLEELTSAGCTDAPGIDSPPPVAGFDTYQGEGTGRLNGGGGATAEWTFTDAGEPGKDDTARIVIRNASNAVVLDTGVQPIKGNHQAHG